MADLVNALKNYGIKGNIINETKGPLLDIIEFEPSAGTKLKEITTSLEDIRREMGVTSLFVEPMKDKNAFSFEMPRQEMEIIDLKAGLDDSAFLKAKEKYALPLFVGVDIRGVPYYADLAKMPHLLVGGTTGSGKSVGLNTFILSLMAAKKPNEVKFVLIDPKKIEFSIYNNQKYLYHPVITETNEAVAMLSFLAEEMDRRYDVFASSQVKNLKEYNENGDGFLPYIVCIIDEFADLMALDKRVQNDVMRLAQKARAAGIHLILSTQRPSVDVVTGVLKANFPTRLAYKVASSIDSRTILDTEGAEKLVGRGDCLFLTSTGELLRLHGAYIEDREIMNLLAPYKAQVKPQALKLQDETKLEKEKALEPKSNAKVKKEENILLKVLKFWKIIPLKYRNMIKEAVITFVLVKLGLKKGKR